VKIIRDEKPITWVEKVFFVMVKTELCLMGGRKYGFGA
jgi:hypothetical protein